MPRAFLLEGIYGRAAAWACFSLYIRAWAFTWDPYAWPSPGWLAFLLPRGVHDRFCYYFAALPLHLILRLHRGVCVHLAVYSRVGVHLGLLRASLARVVCSFFAVRLARLLWLLLLLHLHCA